MYGKSDSTKALALDIATIGKLRLISQVGRVCEVVYT